MWVIVAFVVFTAITGLLFCILKRPELKSAGAFEPFADLEIQTPDSLVTDSISYKCPTVLLQHGTQLMLFRDSYLIARFSTIDEYVAYMEHQYQNISTTKRTDLHGNQIPIVPCPVLYLTTETNIQGQSVYRRNPDPAYKPNKPVDEQTKATQEGDGVRPFNEYTVGEKGGVAKAPPYITGDAGDPAVSDNAMDPNWGGVIYTQQMVDSGKYDRRTVGKPITGVNMFGLPVV